MSTATAIVEKPAEPAPGWTKARITGHVLLALWALLGLGLVWFLVASWNPELIKKYGPSYLSGIEVTLTLVAISIVLGALLSIPITYARMSKNPILSGFAYAYVYFFRGTPLLAQTFLIYYGLGSFRPQLEMVGLWSFFRDAFNCAIFAFSLNTAAYQAEILRGAIESVPKGQWEGASSLGLRPYGNEVILMIKGSAIVAIITVYDLMGITRLTYSRTFDFQAYIWAAIFYLIMVEALRHCIEWIERRITRHLHR